METSPMYNVNVICEWIPSQISDFWGSNSFQHFCNTYSSYATKFMS